MPEFTSMHDMQAPAGGQETLEEPKAGEQSDVVTGSTKIASSSEKAADFREESNRWWDQQCALLAAVRAALRNHEGRRGAGGRLFTRPDPQRVGYFRVVPPSLDALETLWESSVTEQEVIRSAAIDDVTREQGTQGDDPSRGRRFAFVRHLTNEDALTGLDTASGRGFVDGASDRADSSARLAILKAVVLGDETTNTLGLFDPECVYSYDVEFGKPEHGSTAALQGDAPNSDPITIGVDSHPGYLLTLGADMAVSLESALKREMQNREASTGLGPGVYRHLVGSEADRERGEWWDGGAVADGPKGDRTRSGAAATMLSGVPSAHSPTMETGAVAHSVPVPGVPPAVLESWQAAVLAALPRVTADVVGASQFAIGRA